MKFYHFGDITIGVPPEPQQCGLCFAMSGAFYNWRGDTYCCRCFDEDLSSPVERKVAA